MNNKILISITCLLIAACASIKYPNWEMVRIEHVKPSSSCKYKIQEVCDPKLFPTSCLNWHKKRATIYEANTVVVTDSGSNVQIYGGVNGGFMGGEYQSTVADYYSCPESIK